jgi:hypothetical protein
MNFLTFLAAIVPTVKAIPALKISPITSTVWGIFALGLPSGWRAAVFCRVGFALFPMFDVILAGLFLQKGAVVFVKLIAALFAAGFAHRPANRDAVAIHQPKFVSRFDFVTCRTFLEIAFDGF